MKKIDYLGIDGHTLKLFLTVLEEQSVGAAAARLDLTQSAVSHALDRLRRMARDPLFVKSGRGIVATAHARGLADHARRLLNDMQTFAQGAKFNPADAELSLTVAANDFQRDLLLPGVFRKLSGDLKGVSLRVIPSGLPTVEMLRNNVCDLMITPRPPKAVDVMQRLLFRDRYVCYFDPAARKAPRTLRDYLSSRHVTVVYPHREQLDFDQRLAARGVVRDIAVSVPSFTGAAAFISGSALLSSMPSLLARTVMAKFSSVAIPLGSQGNSTLMDLPMYLVWHRRFQADPMHSWLRRAIEQTVRHLTRKV